MCVCVYYVIDGGFDGGQALRPMQLHALVMPSTPTTWPCPLPLSVFTHSRNHSQIHAYTYTLRLDTGMGLYSQEFVYLQTTDTPRCWDLQGENLVGLTKDFLGSRRPEERCRRVLQASHATANHSKHDLLLRCHDAFERRVRQGRVMCRIAHLSGHLLSCTYRHWLTRRFKCEARRLGWPDK